MAYIIAKKNQKFQIGFSRQKLQIFMSICYGFNLISFRRVADFTCNET